MEVVKVALRRESQYSPAPGLRSSYAPTAIVFLMLLGLSAGALAQSDWKKAWDATLQRPA